jgi:hypothetical protein
MKFRGPEALNELTRYTGTAKRRASHIRHTKLWVRAVGWEFLGKTALNATLRGQ